MYGRFILFVIAAAIAVATVYWQFLWIAPAKYSATLGTPGPHNVKQMLDNLPLDISFEKKRGRILSHQAGGEIVSWDLKSGKPMTIAQTSGLYGYCPSRQQMMLSDGSKILLRDLAKRENRTIVSGRYRYIAWNKGCSVFVLSRSDANEIEVWRREPLSKIAVIPTAAPIRNGLALSDDGAYLAVAEGTHDDKDRHQTKIEIFSLKKTVKDGSPAERTALLEDSFAIFGMWKMVFVPQEQTLFLGSQIKASAGLRNVSPTTGDTLWGHDGFASYWVRAFAASKGGDMLITGDEKGMLRAWDAKSGSRIFQRRTGLVIQATAFSEDGKDVAIALWDSTIGIMNLKEVGR